MGRTAQNSQLNPGKDQEIPDPDLTELLAYLEEIYSLMICI